ncbi:MAG: hypothetical protein RL392_2310 [Pseudomonadota bacterium]|jgi:hypothetical protein
MVFFANTRHCPAQGLFGRQSVRQRLEAVTLHVFRKKWLFFCLHCKCEEFSFTMKHEMLNILRIHHECFCLSLRYRKTITQMANEGLEVAAD